MNNINAIIKDNTIDKAVGKGIIKENKEKVKTWKKSGKLSASMLYWPLQWQILKNVGVPQKPFDEYVLRKFKRGVEVEEWLIERMPGVVESQKLVEYKGAIGYADVIIDSKDYEFKKGIIPHEIKSTINAKFRRILYAKKPDKGHTLQGAFYGLGLDTEYFAIDYISADDYRVETFIEGTHKYKDEIDKIIRKYNKAMKLWKSHKIVPKFESNEKWQENATYNNYPKFMKLTEKQASKLAVKLVKK